MTKKKLYELTDEHRAQLGPWAAKWIANAMSTQPMDDSDREAMTEAIHGLYDAANLKRPKNIVFVASPRVLAFAGSIAAGVWHLRRDEKFARSILFGGPRPTKFQKDAAMRAATSAATDAATYDATDAATYDATDDATRAATYAAMRAATRAATDAATYDAQNISLSDAALWLLSLSTNWWRMSNGGNMWSGWVSFLSFFRHISKLDLPVYEKFRHYEAAAIHGGYRIMTPDFAMVSDRPEILKTDQQNRPHCEDGPSHRWHDGWELFFYHGISIPEAKSWIITRPNEITVAKIDAEENSEIKRVMIDKYGAGRYLVDSGAKAIHRDEFGVLYSKRVGDEDLLSVRVLNSTAEPDGVLTADEARMIFGEAARYVVDGGRYKEYFLDVEPSLRPLLDDSTLGEPQELTARNAVASTFGLRGSEYNPGAES